MTAVSKEEYLKRYLSGPAQGDKKKKKKRRHEKETKPGVVVPRMRIVDTDVDVPSAITEEPVTYTIGDDEGGDIEELPQIAAVEDHRDLQVRLDEEFKKSGKWRTFTGEDIARKNLINEVIKLEQSNLKDEPMDEEEMSEFLKSQKPKKKVKVEVKEEPVSPLRGNRDSSDESAPRSRRRHDSDSDESPPRRRRDSDGSSSPELRRRHDSDASPPRKRKDSDSDASPPRKRVKEEPDSDASPPRRIKKGSDSDLSPVRRGGNGGSDSDLSPPRVGEGMGKGVKKTLDGKKAGLQNARDLKEELRMIKDKERKKMEALPDEVSGKNAETKIRGRLAEKGAKLKAEKEKKEVPEEIKEKMQSDLHEMSKPLTRGVDDEDRENHLKDVEHADDPMLQYMRKKRSKAEGKMKAAGEK